MIDERNTELYWHGKHPVVSQLYRGRPVPGGRKRIEYDVRRFVWRDDATVRRFVDDVLNLGELRGTIEREPEMADTIARHVQCGIVDYLTYAGDTAQFNHPEFWLFPSETIDLKRGDCEDGGFLLAACLLDLGVPAWRVRPCAGSVKPAPTASEGGHLWVNYLRSTDWQWVALDWCFYEDSEIKIRDKKPVKKRPEYLHGEKIWFSCTADHAYSHRGLTIEGRVSQ